MDDGILMVGDDDFDHHVLGAPVPVLVEFTADWCPPCRQLRPHLAALAQANRGRLLVAAVEVDRNPRLVSRYDISALPSMLVVAGGFVVDEFEGAPPPAVLLAELAPHVPGIEPGRPTGSG